MALLILGTTVVDDGRNIINCSAGNFSGIITATTFNGSLSGNSSTATKLATARTIGGVSFDGSANINLPGVNTAGNQDTSGNAATATTASTANALNTANNYRVNSFGVGTNASGTAGEIRATNDITAFYSSDERLKENIHPIPNALEKLDSISGNTFDWKEGFEEVHSHEGSDCGVIAQEIESLNIPGLVTDRENGYKAVRYEKLTALLIEAVKELKSEVNELKSKLEDN